MTLEPLRVLLVEDDEDDFVLTRDLLAAAGERRFELTWACTVEEGLRRVRDERFDAVLLDYRVGAESGLDFLRRLSADPSAPPVVLLSGLGDRGVDVAAMESGAVDYLEKGELSARLLERSLRYAVEQRRSLAALRESEARFRQLADSADTVFWVYDGASEATVYVSPAAQRVWGRSAAELTGGRERWLRFMHPEDAAALRQTLTPLSDALCDTEYRIVRPDGEVRWIRDRSFPVRDGQGRTYRSVGIAEDVTERKRADAALRSQALLFGALHDAVVVMDPCCRVTDWNPGAERLFGCSREQVLGRSMAELFHPDERARLEPVIARLRTSGGRWQGDARFLRPDGQEGLADVVVAAQRADGGESPVLIGVARDVTLQRRAREELERRERRFRSLVENAPDGLAVLDADGTFAYCSPGLARILGRPTAQLVGSDAFALVHPDDVEAGRAAFGRVLAEPEGVQRAELRVLHADGTWRRVEFVGQSQLQDPAVGGVVVNSRDLTEAREAEAALRRSEEQLLQAQKMEAVGRLAGGIAHDFNNLLTAIHGNAEMLLLESVPGQQNHDDVLEIKRAAGRAADLTRQLLAFSRKQVLKPRPVALGQLLGEMQKMLARLLGEDMELRLACEPDLPNVSADPGQVEQVVVNLAVNARDAMPRGGTLTLATRPVEVHPDEAELDPDAPEPGRYVELSVADTGTGMPPEVLERIFEPFFTTKEPGKGTGLGLSTVYGIVKQSGGAVRVESRPGAGSVFRVLLPLARGADEVDEAPPGALSRTERASAVLVVEDEAAVRRLVRRILERVGHRVLEAERPSEAEAVLRGSEEPVHLLLTDVVMPGGNGWELAERLRRLRPGMGVLLMSGYNDEALRRHGVESAGVPLIAKPFTPEELLRRVEEALSAAAASA